MEDLNKKSGRLFNRRDFLALAAGSAALGVTGWAAKPGLALVAPEMLSSGILAHEDLNAIDRQVAKLVHAMTLDEKMLMMHGVGDAAGYGGTPPIPRLHIPPYILAHGPFSAKVSWPMGDSGKRTLRMGTFMSCSMNYAASWDPDLVRRVAVGIGQEIRSAGNDSVAGPAINIVRDLRDGRSAEYYTEDPYLNARTAVAFVNGVQSQYVIATLKHFACNNQGFWRSSIDVRVSKRALNEIYLPGFEYAVKEGNAMSVMSAYNQVNGEYCAQNPYLLDDELRQRWGFKGLVMSDYSGTHSTVPTVEAGLDLEMPRVRWYGAKLKQAVESGEVPESLIDKRVSNILRTMFVAKCFDPNFKNPPASDFKSEAMKQLAYELGLNSIVLLKNENHVLPFDKNTVKKVAVVGPVSSYGEQFNGGKYDFSLFEEGGSAHVAPDEQDMITPLQGIRALLGDKVEVVYSPGCYAENGCGPIASQYFMTNDGKPGLSVTYFAGTDFKDVQRQAVDPTVSLQAEKEPQIPEAGRPMKSGNHFCARWTGKLMAPMSRAYTLELRFDGQAKLEIDGRVVFDGEGNGQIWWHQVKVNLAQGSHDLVLEYQEGHGGIMKLWWDYENLAWTQQAVDLAKDADAVIVNVGNSGNMEREGRDRFWGLQLCEAQQNLIRAVGKTNPKTAVVTFTAGVGMEGWIQDVPAVMAAIYPGQEGGKALAQLLFGEVTPSGKLPVTLPTSVDQYPKDHWPGTADNIDYKEGVFVGYRYFDQNHIEPQFPFGHGLSYTTFAYGEPKLQHRSIKIGEPVSVSLKITNTGNRAGAEVVQLYVHDVESSVPRPPKELKAFQKVFLQPGEAKTVTLTLDKRSFAFFSEQQNDWVVEPGKFDLLIGSSSRDIRRTATCTVL